MENHEVIIIGAGPAGLAAAAQLRQRGINDVVVLEREEVAGGALRHCGHFGFGWESHRRLMTGPKLAGNLVNAAHDIDIRTRTTVLEFTLHNTLRVHSAKGISEMSARRILLATGTREASRAARLIGGHKLQGVVNTGTLQQLVYLKHQKPFSNPVIIGHEWVTFSALLTCRHAGIKPVGIFSETEKIDAPWFFPLGARAGFGVSVHNNSKLRAIRGAKKVEAVEIERDGKIQTIACDGVVISGHFQAETSLLDGRGLDILKIGNAAGLVDTAGTCVVKAKAAADKIAGDLR